MVERNSLFAHKRYITALLSCSIHGMGEGQRSMQVLVLLNLGLCTCFNAGTAQCTHDGEFADSTNQLSIPSSDQTIRMASHMVDV